jgi:hypothetical protein
VVDDAREKRIELGLVWLVDDIWKMEKKVVIVALR